MQNSLSVNIPVKSLYILKCVCAILVVYIHLPGLSCEATILQPLMRIGVPSFLMISGYFLFSGDKLDTKSIWKQIKKLVKLMLGVYSIYISFSFVKRACMGMPLIPEDWKNVVFWIRLLLVGDGIDSILWYLTSYLEALVLLYLLSKMRISINKEIILYIIAPVLLGVAVLLNRYSFVLNSQFDIAWSRNALTVALPCLAIGGCIKQMLCFISKDSSIWAVIICIILAYVEYGLLHFYGLDGSGADFNLMTFPTTATIFLFCLKCPDMSWLPSFVQRPMLYIGKIHSGNIYLYHSLVFHILLLIVFYGIHVDWMLNAEFVIALVVILSICKTYIKDVVWNFPKLNS